MWRDSVNPEMPEGRASVFWSQSSLKADSAAFLLLNPGKVAPTSSFLAVSVGVQASLSTKSLRSEHQLDQRSSPRAIL